MFSAARLGPRCTEAFGLGLSRLPVQFHSKLDNARVARSVVFAEERAERPVLIGRLAAKVIGDNRLVVAGEDPIAGDEQRIATGIGAVRHYKVDS